MRHLFILLFFTSAFCLNAQVKDKDECKTLTISCNEIEKCFDSFEDTNTEYTFNFDCEDAGLRVEIEDNNGNSIVNEDVDLSCHIELVMQDEIENLQDQIDDIDIQSEKCTGTFENCSNRSGVRFTRPQFTTAQPWEYTDWARAGNNVVTSPDCITDLQIVANLGERYLFVDNSCIYMYFDTRLLINGATVQTRVADSYDYECEHDNRNSIDIDDIKTVTFHRDNVPAGSTVEVEFRMRSLYTSMIQPSPTARIVWSGIRSEASFSFHPNEVVTEITSQSVKYWVKEDFSDLPFASSYEFGQGDVPQGAKSYGSETAMNNQVERTQKQFDELLNKALKESQE